jgi:CheY-like chemotaxis protein
MKKILLVEDDPIVGTVYRNKFLREGYDVQLAADGESALDQAPQYRPDLVILDLCLPKMPGLEVIRKLRAEPHGQNVPLVVFTNTYLNSMIEQAWKAGATRCVSKTSCRPQEMLDLVRQLIPQTEDRAAMARQTPDAAPQPSEAAITRTLNEATRATLLEVRSQVQSLFKAAQEREQLVHLRELHSRIHRVTSNAAALGLIEMGHLSEALEALVKELKDKPRNLTQSCLRTVALAIDRLIALSDTGLAFENRPATEAHILVVDDEPISRRAVACALEKVRVKCLSVEDPEAGLKLLQENAFDLVFLDVDMPRMNGFEFCQRLRQMPAHENTAVVFVTGLNNLEARAKSMISGGNDFIVKPFLFLELAVKALVCLSRPQRPAPQTVPA